MQDPADTGFVSMESTINNDVTPTTTGIFAVTGKNRHVVQGTSILTLTDNYFVRRYRAKNSANVAFKDGGGWSKWTAPQLAEGWIKRVLAGINPFQQKIKDLFSDQIDTSVSLVQQAGKRWEGNVALNLDSIGNSGLIEIYETVLNRRKMLSIEGTPAINYGGANVAFAQLHFIIALKLVERSRIDQEVARIIHVLLHIVDVRFDAGIASLRQIARRIAKVIPRRLEALLSHSANPPSTILMSFTPNFSRTYATMLVLRISSFGNSTPVA